MRLALLIILMFASTAARADPVTAAVAAFATWAGVTTATVYLVGGTLLLTTGVAVYGAAQARRAERDARDARNAAMQDRMANRIATEAPHRIIYGRAKVGADIVAMFSSGDKDQYKHIVCVLAAHECDAVEEVYVNNVAVGLTSRTIQGDVTVGRYAPIPGTEVEQEEFTGTSFTLSKYPVGAVQVFTMQGIHMTEIPATVSGRTVTIASSAHVIINYEYSVARRFGESVDETALVSHIPYVRVQVHLGTPTDPADEYLMSVVPDKWAPTSVLRGLCYLVVTLDLNNPEFQGGQVPIHALVRGKKIYDPRTGLTAWSQNPPCVIYDYLTSPLCGVAAADLPVSQFITAANVCDEAVLAGGDERYTLNGTVTSDQSQTSVLEAMAQCMAGGIVSTTWDIYAGKYVAPVLALDQSDIVGGLSITPGASDASIFNGVKGQFISDENDYVLTDYEPFQNPTYLAADGRDLYTDIPLPFTDSLQRVHNLARIFTEDMRNGFTLKAEFSLKAWPIKVGQRVTFTSSFLGQTAKVYRVTDKSFSPTSPVELTLKEDSPSIWDFADAVEVDSTPNTNLPDPWAIDPIASLTCTSGLATLLRQADGSIVPRILVTFPAATTQAVFTNGEIEIEWRAISTDTWQKTKVSGHDTEAYLSPITPGYFYVVRARTVNPYLNVKSDWIMVTYQVAVFRADAIVYKWSTTKPATPTGTSTYTWTGGTISAAPSGWSSSVPTAPGGGDSSLWAATAPVSDISSAGTTAIDWSLSDVAAIGYAPSVAGAGPAGYSNARVYAYQRSASAPAGTPGAVDVDLTTGLITTSTLANGWLKTIPASNGNPLYVTSASASAAGTTDTIASGEWSGAVVLAYDGGAGTPGTNGTNGTNGAPGLNNATVTIYQRAASATAPALPSATTTYTFATGALNGLNNGWTQYIPTSGGAYLHTSLATAAATTATDTIAASEWATVTLMYDATALIAAQAAADAANAAIAVIADDNKLSKGEKSKVILDSNAIGQEYAPLIAQASAYSVDSTTYTAKYTALGTYLASIPGGWNTLSVDSAIVGTDFRAAFTDYYTAKINLLNAIAAKMGTLSTWAGTTGSGKPSDNASTDITLIASSSIALIGNSAVKTAGASWDQQVTSVESFSAGAYASCQVAVGAFMFGLNTDPTTDASFTSIDHAIFTDPNGTLNAYRNGTSYYSGTWSVGDVFLISYTGNRVSYQKNGVEFYAVAESESIKYYFDSSMRDTGAKMTNIRFGPMTPGTIGAPAGTQVNGVPVETLTGQAAAGATANTTLNTAISITGLNDQDIDLSPGVLTNLGTYTGTNVNASGTITVVWSIEGGSGAVVIFGDNKSNSVVLKGRCSSGQAFDAYVTKTIVDSQNRTATATFLMRVSA